MIAVIMRESSQSFAMITSISRLEVRMILGEGDQVRI